MDITFTEKSKERVKMRFMPMEDVKNDMDNWYVYSEGEMRTRKC